MVSESQLNTSTQLESYPSVISPELAAMAVAATTHRGELPEATQYALAQESQITV
jgi:hypothetical protein